jgi:histidine ammonia-lyase
MKLDGENLTAEKLVLTIRSGEKIEISSEAKDRINASRAFVEEMFAKKELAYGTTTGIGELANVVLSPEKARKLSTYMVYSHASGFGKPVSDEECKSAIISRLNVFCKGVSGVRLEVVEFIAEMINRGVVPVMYPASVGACGDLAPLAQAMLVPLGKGEAFFNGERMSGEQALEMVGLQSIQYEIRDGLAVINGSQLTVGLGALAVTDTNLLVKTSEIIAALTFEALKAVPMAFTERIFTLRGFPGGVKSARNIRKLIDGSNLIGSSDKVQNAYSIRSTPQVIGAVKDSLNFTREQIEIELNAGADNPLFPPGQYLAGANFQGTPIALPLELLGIAVTNVSVISERRLNRLVNPNLNEGLPGFLINGAGMYSGIMIPQYTAASLVNRNRILCTPAATGSIPTAADQEDFVSMGTNTAIKTREIIDNSFGVLAIELLAAAQAVDFRKQEGGKLGKGTQIAYDIVRKYVTFLEEDRPLYPDIEKLAEVLKSGEILQEVEKVVGGLE